MAGAAVRVLLKTSLYHGGLTPAYHRRRNRRSLTVVMFHRVLPAGDPEWADAQPVWTLSDVAFQDCLEFFERHYNVIGSRELSKARLDSGELPDRSLLITFDDGWSDNEWCALPILKTSGLPCIVFVVAGAVGQEEFWQEAIRRSWRQGRLKPEHCRIMWKRVSRAGFDPANWDGYGLEDLIQGIASAPSDIRSEILSEISSIAGKPLRPQMLSEQQLRDLHAAGVTIGSHGLTHTPISRAADAGAELCESRSRLAAILRAPESEIAALSFPNGIYDDAAVSRAEHAGYEWIFTSDKGLVPTPAGRALPRTFGRLNMDGPQLSGGAGRVRPEQLASWLFDRPVLGSNAA